MTEYFTAKTLWPVSGPEVGMTLLCLESSPTMSLEKNYAPKMTAEKPDGGHGKAMGKNQSGVAF